MNASNNRPSILIVEDHVQQFVMRTLCERFGFTAYCLLLTLSVRAQKRFLRWRVATCNRRYDAILMEWKMPIMDGSDTTCVIRKIDAVKGTHTPIIAVTAYAMVGDREHCLNAGTGQRRTRLSASIFPSIIHPWKVTPLPCQSFRCTKFY